MSQTIIIDPVTRIEGHAKITLKINEQGEVDRSALSRDPVSRLREVLRGPAVLRDALLMARICGICPVSHLIASAKACDAILAVEIPPTAAKLRAHPEPGADHPVARAELLLSLLAGPAAGHGRRSRRSATSSASSRPIRNWAALASAAAIRPADHRNARRQAHPSRLGRAGRRDRAADRRQARRDSGHDSGGLRQHQLALDWYKQIADASRKRSASSPTFPALPRPGDAGRRPGIHRRHAALHRCARQHRRRRHRPSAVRRVISAKRSSPSPIMKFPLLQAARLSRRRLSRRSAGAPEHRQRCGTPLADAELRSSKRWPMAPC